MAEFLLKYADTRGRNPPAGGQCRLGEGTARPLHPAGFPDLFDQNQGGTVRPLGGLFQAQKAQHREVPDLQPAVRHPDPRRPADPESARPAGRPAHRSQAGTLHQIRARRGAQRHAALRRLPHAGHFPQDLCHHRDGRREKRQLVGSPGPFHQLSEDLSGGEEKGDGFVDVSVRADLVDPRA